MKRVWIVHITTSKLISLVMLIAVAVLAIAAVSFNNYRQAWVRHMGFSNTTEAHKDPAPTLNLDSLAASVNQQRSNNGLQPLIRNPLLDKSAQDKCNDMVTHDYWSHDTPEGTEPWEFIKKYAVYYYSAGENLAYGFGSSESVVVGWMNSPEHRANILNAKFTDVGYAQCKYSETSKEGRQTLIVQHFAQVIRS